MEYVIPFLEPNKNLGVMWAIQIRNNDTLSNTSMFVEIMLLENKNLQIGNTIKFVGTRICVRWGDKVINEAERDDWRTIVLKFGRI